MLYSSECDGSQSAPLVLPFSKPFQKISNFQRGMYWLTCIHFLHVHPLHHIPTTFFLKVFEERSKEHEKYGGDPEQPHKLHIVTRVRTTIGRPYWEKKVVKSLGLEKVTICRTCAEM